MLARRQLEKTITVGKLLKILEKEDKDKPLVYREITKSGYPIFRVLRIEDFVIIDDKGNDFFKGVIKK